MNSIIKVFKDGSKCIVDEGNKPMMVGEIINLRLGEGLNFIDGIRLVDGTFIQNMQYDMKASIPTPGELAEKFSQFGAICHYFSNTKTERAMVKKGQYVLSPDFKPLGPAIMELKKIFKKNYYKDPEFKRELAVNLAEKTGNENLGNVCMLLIENT